MENQVNPGMPFVLTVPGLGNSGADHWQTLWEAKRGDCARVDLGNWQQPHRNSWVMRLNQAIEASPRPAILVAHSLGCLAVAWWVALQGQVYGWPIGGALLVAPPDCERDFGVGAQSGFQSLPDVFLPFPSIVVASRNDPYAEFDYARSLARGWGSYLVDAGDCGHINAESGLGEWPYGERLLERLVFAAENRGSPPAPRERALSDQVRATQSSVLKQDQPWLRP